MMFYCLTLGLIYSFRRPIGNKLLRYLVSDQVFLPFGFVSVLQPGDAGPVVGSALACTVPLTGDDTFEG